MPYVSVLPVLDLKAGAIVRGIAGQRAAYQPIRSCIAHDSRPDSVSRALVSCFGFREAYLADLDAIAGDSPNWASYDSIADCGLDLIIDAGIADIARAQLLKQLAEARNWISGTIVGLESIGYPELLAESCSLLGPSRAIFSLDLQSGRPLTSIDAWRAATPRRLTDVAYTAGYRRFVVLDLAAVGTGSGPATMSLCRDLRIDYPDVEIISGGGIRSAADVQTLLDAGCDRVLVASALHDGRLSRGDLATLTAG